MMVPFGSTEAGMLNAAPLVPLLPLLGAALVGLLGTRMLKGASHWPVIIGIAGALVASFLILGAVASAQPGTPAGQPDTTYRLFSWFSPLEGLWFDVNFCIDALTAIMLVTVCGISLLVAIYSRDYMRVTETETPEGHEGGPSAAERLADPHVHGHQSGHHQPVPERGYERYFAFIGLFVFSMCTLVLAGNFLLLYLGWEAVGLCSYLLIGFYYQRPAAAAAAKKAFLVNRIGDFGFGLGILFLYLWLSPWAPDGRSPLDYDVAFATIHRLDTWQITTIALLLFCGAVGKSAQLPLYVWLPDAMEGPSPVSALIHAATMVTAGVYMVVRCGEIFVQAPVALAIVAAVGAVTALFAATIAVAQYDMKRILAYSTISQLGYMFLGVGVLAADSAIFHLFTHAFFKALLFLGAGSVMHALAGIIDLRQFGGLRRVLPVTYATFVIGALALAGFPLLSGFFSKDEIIHAAFAHHPVLGTIGLITAVLTAFYTFRMVFMAFAGPERIPAGTHPHESGRWMLVPLVLLAVGAVGAGYVGVHMKAGGFLGFIEPHGPFHRFLAPVVEPYAATLHARVGHEAAGAAHEGHVLMYISALLAIAGILVAYVLYVRRRDWAKQAREAFPVAYQVLHNKYYVDELNDAAIVRPLWDSSRVLFGVDRIVVDGLVWAVSAVPRVMGFLVRPLQNGALQSYGVSMTAGMAVIVLIVWLVSRT
ncbi:MAG TPA: NADH-quinone oxidoreductase subunit L [Phycisphaerae bacterium]|jgi:NADH-quinone oxidoreductase subunit L|nr:NADH-quinone oxidoreductase subunit L [Phycisphaerae bacterium]HOB73328.1 NADH-quinone oxidoreductase subunit L [Phycisphaerae bacterium]HOJ55422.1 NADH-quinone oxidoreductase subunit L [Phycisphaerae bacterium]HOL24970.1 NADH-quinone oxidoreductase subunit L [Phycisphaerae bacterium]HPP20072.1 NADH-quinone oxidoreductase subunit L [Phycisphaerae bacterium]